MISNFKRTLFLILISSVLLSCGNENTTEVSNNDTTMDTNVGISLGISNMLLGIINGDSLIITAKPIIEKTDTIYSNIVVRLGNKELYRDNREYYSTLNKENYFVQKVDNTIYVFIYIYDPLQDRWCVVEYRNNKTTVHKNILKNIFKDIDGDGFFEIGGRYSTDAICLNCDSTYYSPFLIYSMRDKLVFDSVLSKTMTMELYDTFLGFDVLDTILIEKDINKLPTGSILKTLDLNKDTKKISCMARRRRYLEPKNNK